CKNLCAVAIRNSQLKPGVEVPPSVETVVIAQVLAALLDTGNKQEQQQAINALIQLTPPPAPPTAAAPGPGIVSGPPRVPQTQPFAPPQFARTIVAFDG